MKIIYWSKFLLFLGSPEHNRVICKPEPNDRKPGNLSTNKKIISEGSEEIPDITINEKHHALRKMENGKAPGEDRVMTEAIKNRGQELINRIQKLFNICLHKQGIPENGTTP